MDEDQHRDRGKNTGKGSRRTKVREILETLLILLAAALMGGGVYFLYKSNVYHDVKKPQQQSDPNAPHYADAPEVTEEGNSEGTGTDDTSGTSGTSAAAVENSIVQYTSNDLPFELPVSGATGYAPCAISIRDAQDAGNTIASMAPGDAFEILEGDDSGIWKIRCNGTEGWVDGNNCMINLPDVIPSIIYYDSNSVSSLFLSSGIRLPDVTGEKLYSASSHNARFDTEQFNMPVFYGMALKIYAAQQEALQQGDCLMIYESFRPYETQMKVMSALDTLDRTNSKVHAGINSGSWNSSWFIAQSLSDHQRGVAIDTSLVHLTKWEKRKMGDHEYAVVTECSLGDVYSDDIPTTHGDAALVSGKIVYDKDQDCQMPTDIHELSIRACTFQYGVASHSVTAWKSVKPASTMTSFALKLQKYCTDAGLTPLSSEWWHFGDLDALSVSQTLGVNGSFALKDNVSSKPEK